MSLALGADFQTLHRRVRSAGLLEPQPLYHAIQFGRALGFMALGWLLVSAIQGAASFTVAAVALGFAYVQTGMVMHDACHRTLFRSRWASELVRMVCGNLCIGVSCGWWTHEHNRHHAYPNRQGLDPDIGVPHLAFTNDQAAKKPTVIKSMMRWQAWFFFPMLMVQSAYLRVGSYLYLATSDGRNRVLLEIVLIVVHWSVYFGLVFSFLPPLDGLLFGAAHHAAFGFYAGMVFGAGHKGMPMLDRETDLGFLERQVMTTRDLKANWFTDLWYGGLHYQIEHHLFPGMAPNRFKEARVIIKAFCHENGISFKETGILTSYRQILSQLAAVRAPPNRKPYRS